MRARAILLGFGAVMVLVLAWSPLPTLLMPGPFSAHMARHLLLVAVAAPLLGIAAVRAAPTDASRVAARCPPLAASAIEFVVVWAWHAPLLHHAARGGHGSLLAEQGLFLGSGLLLWLTALARPQAGVVALLLTAMHMTLLGVLLALSRRPLFGGDGAVYDQEIGGVLMLAVGGAVYLLGGLVLLAGLLRPTRSAGRQPCA